MTFGDYLRAFLKYWWLLLLLLSLGIAGATAVTAASHPVYRGTVEFYVVAQSTERQTALQSDELVRGRITAYAVLLKSDQFADRIVRASQENLDKEAVKDSISGYGDPETLTLTVNVMDPSKETADEIATQIAETFGKMVNDLESGATSETLLNVISGPTTSDQPVRPRPQLNLAIGSVIGLGVGALIVLMRVRTNKSIRTASQLEDASGLTNLAAVPNSAAAGASGGLGNLAGEGFAEAMRMLRTSLQHYPGAPPQVIAVTSPNNGEGKTTAAMRLAQAYTETHARVLLVETDLRTPAIAAATGLERSPGLSDVLDGLVPAGAALQSVGDLDVMVAGESTHRPSELLSASHMHALLAELRSSYDVLVLDTTAVLPCSDASIVCAEADGALLVLAKGRTPIADLDAALRKLGSVQCLVLGTLLNRVREDRKLRSRSARRTDRSAAPGGGRAGQHGSAGNASGQPVDVRG